MSDYREGKSGVNVKRLVQNIADQYPFEPQRAAIVELVANALDAKASEIRIDFNEREAILVVDDNGFGMERGQFKSYHDFASTTKERGRGIGFAGQGAKLALNFCKRIVTETWSANYRGYSEWFLKGNDAPFRIYDNTLKKLDHIGTRVTLYLDDRNARFYGGDALMKAISEDYFPLIDRGIREFYRKEAYYKDGVRIWLNGKELLTEKSFEYFLEGKHEIHVSLTRNRQILGVFGIIKDGGTLEPGVMICTFGKVIERTYFKKEPKEKDRIFGWIEAPDLIDAVTTDKCRFQRGNKIWEDFFKKAAREFSIWLSHEGFLEIPPAQRLDYVNVEKEINAILKNLPELSFFGASISRDVAMPDKAGQPRQLVEGTQHVPGTQGGDGLGGEVLVHPGDGSGVAASLEEGAGPGATARTRTIRGGIRVAEEEREDIDREAWFDGETVVINKAHPAYKRARLCHLLNYHILKSVALVLIEFNLDNAPEPSYEKVFELQRRFFRVWGEQ